MHLILFLIFGMLCLAGAINLLLQRHPINSALSLIVVMASLAVLYLMLGAEFLAAAQIIVYSGAIMVLFVFVIMLLNAGVEELTHGSRAAYVVGIPGVSAIIAVMTAFFFTHRADFGTITLGSYYVSTAGISRLLFRDLLLAFEVTSILILIAILGAVVLAQRHASQEDASQ